MSNHIAEAANMFEAAFTSTSTGEKESLSEQAMNYMEENRGAFDMQEEMQALVNELVARGLLPQLALELADEFKPIGKKPPTLSQDKIEKLAKGGEGVDALTQLAAIAVLPDVSENETLTNYAFKKEYMDRAVAQTSVELLKMFGSENEWRSLAGNDCSLDEDELDAAIASGTYQGDDLISLKNLKNQFETFDTANDIEYDDVEDVFQDRQLEHALNQLAVKNAEEAKAAYADDTERDESADSSTDKEEEEEEEEETDSTENNSGRDEKIDDLRDVLEDKNASPEEKLSAIEKLSEKGVTKITVRDADGSQIDCHIQVTEIPGGGGRKYVHLYDSSSGYIILRAIGDDGKYSQQRDKYGNYVSYVGERWSKRHPDSAIAGD